MIIYYHQTIDAVTGAVKDQHFIDTTEPGTIAMFTAFKADPTKRAAAGWDRPVTHPLALAADTKYTFLVRRVNAIAGADPIKALGLA